MKKDIFLVILALICLSLAIVLFTILQKDDKINKSIEEERFSRMVAEESLQKSAAKISTLEVQLKSATEKMGKVQDLIDQQKTANADLQKQYEDLNRMKADLEAKLKIASEEKIAPPVEAVANKE
jgi:septal ring factor EnvC (AmiA/AmiB activator)